MFEEGIKKLSCYESYKWLSQCRGNTHGLGLNRRILQFVKKKSIDSNCHEVKTNFKDMR